MAGECVIDEDYLTRALLQLQYLPNIREDNMDIPPFFSSETFSLQAAEALALHQRSRPRATWKKWVTLRTRRFDGLIRHLGLPHPCAYAELVLHIRDHWVEMAPMLKSSHSQIKPKQHFDGRLVVMDYADPLTCLNQQTRLAQGKTYRVEADISNCFPSIYTHAVDWAMRGKRDAKNDTRSDCWSAILDKKIQSCTNGETKGLMIGPAVSNLLAELILQEVDRNLDGTFTRYIDDYKAYFNTREEAESFLVGLQRQLAEFKLDLNTRKTRITNLRDGLGDVWISDITALMPVRSDVLSTCRFLQSSERMAQQVLDKSVLKYAIKAHLGDESRLTKGNASIIDELGRMVQFHPHTLPYLSQEIAENRGTRLGHAQGEWSKAGTGALIAQPQFLRSDQNVLQHLVQPLMKSLEQAVRRRETDTVLWLLYITGCQLECEASVLPLKAIIEMDDDLVWVGLGSLFPELLDSIADRVRDVRYNDRGDHEEHWFARYELFRVGTLKDENLGESEKPWMRLLKEHSVRFSTLNHRDNG